MRFMLLMITLTIAISAQAKDNRDTLSTKSQPSMHYSLVFTMAWLTSVMLSIMVISGWAPSTNSTGR